MSTLTIDTVKAVVPKTLKSTINQEFVDKLNSIVNNPEEAEIIKKNFLGYTSVFNDGRFSIEEYLNAIIFCSYKLMGNTVLQCYIKTYPQRYQRLVAKGTKEQDIRSYANIVNRSKLVNLIMEQSIVPSWILNQDIYQKAINTQAELMSNARSERVRCMAADSILKALAKPEATGPMINIDMRENSGMEELKGALVKLAQQQKQSIEAGTSTPKLIAEADIVEADYVDSE